MMYTIEYFYDMIEKERQRRRQTMNPTIETIMKRKSMRVFTDREISAEDKELILRAAASSPTAGNQQLYTILDITDQKIKDALVDTCDHQPFIATAKMVLIFCADCSKWYEGFKDKGCEPRKPGVGDLLLAASDANIAAQTAVIAAESLGIGSCYIGDIMENYEAQRELLQLPEYVFPAAMLVFGYPTQQQIDRVQPMRAPLETIVSENAYPSMDAAYRQKLFSNQYKERDYGEWMQAFCNRKYNSDFSKEMTRSVGEYIKQFDD